MKSLEKKPDTAALIARRARLSLGASKKERKKKKERLLAAIYLRALTDPPWHSFRDSSPLCGRLERVLVSSCFHEEASSPCDRAVFPGFVILAKPKASSRKKRIALSSSPINPVSFCHPSVRRESKFSLTLAFQVLACRLKKKKSSPWSSLSFSLFHPSGGRFNSKRKAFSLMPPTVASSPPPLENRSSFTERRKRGTKRGRVCRSRVLKACSALRVNSRWGFHEGWLSSSGVCSSKYVRQWVKEELEATLKNCFSSGGKSSDFDTSFSSTILNSSLRAHLWNAFRARKARDKHLHGKRDREKERERERVVI